MNIEIEVKAFGEVEVQGIEDSFKGVEVMGVHNFLKIQHLVK